MHYGAFSWAMRVLTCLCPRAPFSGMYLYIYVGEFSSFRWYKDLLSVYISWRNLMDDTKPCTLNRLPSVQKGRDPCVQAPMYTHTTYHVARAQAPAGGL